MPNKYICIKKTDNYLNYSGNECGLSVIDLLYNCLPAEQSFTLSDTKWFHDVQVATHEGWEELWIGVTEHRSINSLLLPHPLMMGQCTKLKIKHRLKPKHHQGQDGVSNSDTQWEIGRRGKKKKAGWANAILFAVLSIDQPCNPSRKTDRKLPVITQPVTGVKCFLSLCSSTKQLVTGGGLLTIYQIFLITLFPF